MTLKASMEQRRAKEQVRHIFLFSKGGRIWAPFSASTCSYPHRCSLLISAVRCFLLHRPIWSVGWSGPVPLLAPPPPLSASRQSGSLRPTCRRRLPSLRSAAARGLSRGGSHTVTPPRATRLTAARPSPRSFPPSFLSTHLHVRRRSCLGAGEMKLMAPPVLKPSSSGACGSSTSSDGGGPGSEAFLLANATYVSHFGYFQHGAPREFIVFVVRTVAQRTQPGQHEGNYPLPDLPPATQVNLFRLTPKERRCSSARNAICNTEYLI